MSHGRWAYWSSIENVADYRIKDRRDLPGCAWLAVVPCMDAFLCIDSCHCFAGRPRTWQSFKCRRRWVIRWCHRLQMLMMSQQPLYLEHKTDLPTSQCAGWTPFCILLCLHQCPCNHSACHELPSSAPVKLYSHFGQFSNSTVHRDFRFWKENCLLPFSNNFTPHLCCKAA